MAADLASKTFGNGIVAVEMELTSGTWYTLWAPKWTVKGETWQAFLGDDDSAYVFDSPAKLLAFLRSGGRNELADHPRWAAFAKNLPLNVVPAPRASISLIELPSRLAGRPSYENVTAVTRGFDLLESLGNVLGLSDVKSWFASYSLLHNTRRGPEHYNSENGWDEWSGIGRTVLERWEKMLDAIEDKITEPTVEAAALDTATADIEAAQAAAAEKAAALSTKEKAAAAAADPYDATIWSEVGIDPIRISIDGRYVYTLRCYVEGKPVFLGHTGGIFTFPNSRSLTRWLIDAPEHDLAELSTWPDVISAANAGELEVTVHDTNQYSFAGLRNDIGEGIDAVDTDQLARAYELLADTADWAGDDAVNKTLLTYPDLQNYLAYMLGSPSTSTPSAPFDREAKGWRALEESLLARFSKM